MMRVRDPVLLLLGFGGVLAAVFPYLGQAPNRLAHSQALYFWQTPSIFVLAIAAALALVLCAAFIRHGLSLALISGLVLFFGNLVTAGEAAAHLARPDAPAARISLGIAFWALLFISGLILHHAARNGEWNSAARIALGLGVVGGFILLAMAGLFDALSLTREFMSRRDLFTEALLRHIGLVAMALAFALLLSTPIALALLRHPAWRGVVYSTLNLVQTIPSIALFALLIAPLTYLAQHVSAAQTLGIKGIGTTPAVIALVLYALLPLVRGIETGFQQVPQHVKDAARGLGFDKARLRREVELPIALPALVSGLRIVAIQSIGLAGVAALIGAGGLGQFIFQGIGQYALDLVLVGAIPIILLALAADLAFQALIAATRTGAS
jgi:osmoprotectant transport system permease protein